MNLRQAAEKALIQLQGDDAYLGHRSKKRADAIEALRQALAQPDEVLAEREACAKFVEEDYVRQFEEPWRKNLAAAIRARGEK